MFSRRWLALDNAVPPFAALVIRNAPFKDTRPLPRGNGALCLCQFLVYRMKNRDYLPFTLALYTATSVATSPPAKTRWSRFHHSVRWVAQPGVTW